MDKEKPPVYRVYASSYSYMQAFNEYLLAHNIIESLECLNNGQEIDPLIVKEFESFVYEFNNCVAHNEVIWIRKEHD